MKILENYNKEHGTKYDLYTSGLEITTTINAELQRFAEEAAREHMKSLQNTFYQHWKNREPWDNEPAILQKAIRESQVYKRLKEEGFDEKHIQSIMNEKKTMDIYSAYQGEIEVKMSSIDSIKHYLKILQPALVAVDPRTGQVKAWVGGIDFKYFQYDQVLAARQVGSVFKPVVYSAAIEQGANLDAYYANEQKTYPEYDNWSPRNSDNQYGGYYTLKGALCKSINTIAVELLLQTGIETVIEHAHRLGITGNLPDTVKQVSVHKQAVSGLQQDVLLSHLIIQNPGLCFGNFKIRVPVQRSFPAGQFGKFVFKKGDRKKPPFTGNLLAHVLVYDDRHKNLLSFGKTASVSSSAMGLTAIVYNALPNHFWSVCSREEDA